VRKQMREMNALLERSGAHVARIDACVCRMERGEPARAPPAREAAGLFPVAVRPWAMHLFDLPSDMFAIIITELAEDDKLAFALTCRRLRQAIAGTERRTAGVRLSTRIGSV
jgi:hypothetical protein